MLLCTAPSLSASCPCMVTHMHHTCVYKVCTPFNLHTVAHVKLMQSKIAECPSMGLQQVPVMQKVCSPSIASPCMVMSSHAGVCYDCDIVLQDRTLLSSTEADLVRLVV